MRIFTTPYPVVLVIFVSTEAFHEKSEDFHHSVSCRSGCLRKPGIELGIQRWQTDDDQPGPLYGPMSTQGMFQDSFVRKKYVWMSLCDFNPPPHGAQTLAGHGLIIIEASRLNTDTPHSVGLLWTSDQPEAQTSTWQHTTLTSDKTSMPPRGIRTRNPRQQAATGMGMSAN
jgi:hypothetical protein